MISKFFGALFGSYATTAMSVLKWTIIATLIYFVSSNIWKFYNHYTTLTKTISEQSVQIKKQSEDIAFLRGEKESLEQQLKDQKGSEEITNNIALELTENQQTSKDALETVVKERKVVEEKIIKEKVVVTKTKTPNATKGKPEVVVTVEKAVSDSEIPDVLSKVRISSIWKSYCSSNSPRQENVEQCKVILKPD